MKGLILKDFYNLSKNIKLMLGMMVLFGVAFTATGMESSAYVVMWGMLLSIQVVTSFTFDEMSKWTSFAMTMPVTRKEYIRSKFLLHLLLIVCGYLVSLCICILSMAIQRTMTTASILGLLTAILPSMAIALFAGGLSIPLLLKFGTERTRIISILLFIIPVFIGIGLLSSIDLELLKHMQRFILFLLYAAPILALICEYIMYWISCKLFAKMDLTS